MNTNIIAILGAALIGVALFFWVASERAGAQNDPAYGEYIPPLEAYAAHSSHQSYLVFWEQAGKIEAPIH